MKTYFCILCTLGTLSVSGQSDTIHLPLHEAILLAQDSSLSAFRSKYAYEAGYWSFRNYKARRLPTLNMTLNPFTYNRSITKQFNSTDSSYRYYEGQNLNNSIGLNLQQGITLTGGKVYVESDLGRLENFVGLKGASYSATPFRAGINQPIFGFNTYKWEKMIEPLKFQKAKLDFIQSAENIAIETVNLYFALVFAQQNLQIARANFANADTLYQIGQKRFKLFSINKADLLTLQLELINSKNRLKEAYNNYERSVSAICIYLNIPQDKVISTIVPVNISLTAIEREVVFDLARKNNPFYVGIDQQLIESDRDLERIRIESRFSSNLELSFGLNQIGKNLPDAFTNLSDQQMVNLRFQIPLIDWGQKRGRYNLAKSQQKLQSSTLKQREIDFEQDMLISINEFNLQVEMVKSAKEAADVAVEVYEMNKQRFVLGQMDVNTLIMQLNRKENAILSHVNTLYKYWKLYYNLRYLTLFDFETNNTLISDLDFKLGAKENH
ncbi:MAG TPA: TolC family protein [Prolixibacteraceae bacterium]|nr:TolC family protein [Prolixibacteraceae bacterium]